MTKAMKELVTMKSDWNSVKELAKEYEITIGNKEETMEQVNRAILKEQGMNNPKWHELHGFMYSKGDILQILDGHLKGRYAEVVEPSAKKFAVKAQLLHPRTGENQKTTIVLNYDIVELSKSERESLITKEEQAQAV